MKIKLIIAWLRDFVALFFPRICVSCKKSLLLHEVVICSMCKHKLPYAKYVENPMNKAFMVFYGKIVLHSCYSFLIYRKGNRAQQLIHQLKYHGRQDVGLFLGREFGKELLEKEILIDADYILPVPLHPKKEKKRGYNQSDLIAEGLSEVMDIAVRKDILKRNKNSQSQTKRGRYERWENVSTIFALNNSTGLKGSHIILVDDVITTGSTLEACALALREVEGVRISVLSVGFSI